MADPTNQTTTCPHCRNGWMGSDIECVNGVLIDIDVAHEGWQRDVEYPAAPCISKSGKWPKRDRGCQERLEEWASRDAASEPGSQTVTPNTDWMWCYENPREAASEIDRLQMAGDSATEHATLSADLAAAREEIGRLRAALTGLLELHKTVLGMLEAAPEINPSNYDHSDVCRLNDSMIEAFLTMRDAFAGNIVAAARAALAEGAPDAG